MNDLDVVLLLVVFTCIVVVVKKIFFADNDDSDGEKWCCYFFFFLFRTNFFSLVSPPLLHSRTIAFLIFSFAACLFFAWLACFVEGP